MKNTIYLLLILFSCSLKFYSQNEIKLQIKIKLEMSGADSTGGIVDILENGSPYAVIQSEGLEYIGDFNFNSNYLIQCSKPGYKSKAIFFDTHVPNDINKETISKFYLLINLIPQDSVEQISYSFPMGGVEFLPEIKQFGKSSKQNIISQPLMESFEGTLVYKNEVKFFVPVSMAKHGLTEEKLKQKMIQEGTWTDSIKTSYKLGNYISYTNFNPLKWSIYKRETNNFYSFQEGEDADICIMNDASIDSETQLTGIKPKVKKLDSIEEVFGRKCNIVRIEWKFGTYDYYYDSSFLKVNPTFYKKHVYDGWNEFINISHALPVKIVKKVNNLSTVTLTLIRFKEEMIDYKLFELPNLLPDEELNQIKIGNWKYLKIIK